MATPKSERGNKKNRLIDRYVGIPLTVPAALFRRIDRINIGRTGPAPTPSSAAVICLGAIGDLLLCSGLVNALAKKGLAVDIYTTRANAQAASLLQGVRQSRAYSLSKIPTMIKDMRSAHYDLLIDTTQWARVGSIISAFSGAGITVGFRTAGEYRSFAYDLKVHHDRNIHEWENFLNLAKAVWPDADARPGINIPDTTPVEYTNYIILHMWAAGTHAVEKQWPAAKWVQLVEKLVEKGYTVIFTGGPSDIEKTAFIEYLADTKNIINAAGKYSLPELAQLMKHSQAVISVNTGIMHLAALAGARTIGLHGPSNPKRWGPVGENTVALCHEGVNKFPDMEFSLTHDDSSFTKHITVEEVLASLPQDPVAVIPV